MKMEIKSVKVYMILIIIFSLYITTNSYKKSSFKHKSRNKLKSSLKNKGVDDKTKQQFVEDLVENTYKRMGTDGKDCAKEILENKEENKDIKKSVGENLEEYARGKALTKDIIYEMLNRFKITNEIKNNLWNCADYFIKNNWDDKILDDLKISLSLDIDRYNIRLENPLSEFITSVGSSYSDDNGLNVDKEKFYSNLLRKSLG